MKLRSIVLGVIAAYLTCNALFSDSSYVFFANLIAHTYLAVLCSLMVGIIYIVVQSEPRNRSREATNRVEDIKNAFSRWWHKPRPLLDAIIDLLTKPVARQRLIREANTGQLELQLDE